MAVAPVYVCENGNRIKVEYRGAQQNGAREVNSSIERPIETDCQDQPHESE
jgi:hypothetical protein